VPRVYSETKGLPFLGAVVDLDSRHSLYANYTEIFNPQTQVDIDGQLLGPIEGRNIEAGVKGEWFDKRLNGSVAVFRTKQDNTAEYAGFSTFSYFRGINATSTGFELDLAGQVTPGWEISAGYTQLQLEDADGNDARTFVPRRTFRLSTSYRVAAVPGLKVGATVKWQSDIWRVNMTQTTPGGDTIIRRQGSYALLGLAARYDFNSHFNAVLAVNNVTDRKYLSSLYWDQSLYGAPRNATFTLNTIF
jgi:outer membrane receptor for ferric coprogen and ferric-rhodotorulic acid